ncbi:hypothetical protein BSKO_06149 [Bryopsis sp. KO-2023]|nr:hypothetical protein BSKO_06149 [Bryopsis sp. KO-2023]
MAQGSSAGSEMVHQDSLLDLLMRQQTRGEQGVRLSFHQELLSAVSFNSCPYHYCAVTGNAELACYLYSQKIELTPNITVASFSAAGTGGNTPWKKIVVITPHEAALLAGKPRAARTLKLIEKGVPLNWSRKDHRKLPQEFREKVRGPIQSLLQSEWFCRLPGPVRVKVIDDLMNHYFHTMIWSSVSKSTWVQPWEETLGSDVYIAANDLPEKLQDTPKQVSNPQIPQYQFRVAHEQNGQRRRRLGRVFSGLKRAGLGLGWWLLQRQQGGGVAVLPTVGAFVLSGMHPCLQVAPLLLATLGNGSQSSGSR